MTPKTTKRGPLSKSEKFYVESNPDGLTVTQLAKTLNRSENQINKYMKQDIQTEEKVEEVKPKETAFTKVMGTHKRNNKSVATVMTQAASEIADSARGSNKTGLGRFKDSIHKPRG